MNIHNLRRAATVTMKNGGGRGGGGVQRVSPLHVSRNLLSFWEKLVLTLNVCVNIWRTKLGTAESKNVKRVIREGLFTDQPIMWSSRDKERGIVGFLMICNNSAHQ